MIFALRALQGRTVLFSSDFFVGTGNVISDTERKQLESVEPALRAHLPQ